MADATFSLKKTDLNKYLSGSKNKSYFVAAITILFLVIFIILGVVPAYNAVVLQYNQNKERDIALEKLTTKVAALKSLDKQNIEKSKLVEYFSSVFPSDGTQSKVIDQLFSLSEKNSVFISDIAFADESTRIPLDQIFDVSSQVNYLTASINLEGSKIGLQDFVKDLENSRTIFNVISIDLSKKSVDEIEENTENGDHILKVTVQYFYYVQQTVGAIGGS